MLTLGLVSGQSAYGKALKDGAAALFVDGRLAVAVAEERITRRKHDGGFAHAATYCLEAVGAAASDVDCVAFSSCCDPLDVAHPDETLLGRWFRGARIVRVDHHRSHALSAYFASPWERSLIVVADAGGNTRLSGRKWWEQPRDQCTYWLAEHDSLALLGRDFGQPFEAGLGEVYRAATHYLGWRSHAMSNKTMALAGFGEAEGLALPRLFQGDECSVTSPLINIPSDPVGTLGRGHAAKIRQCVTPRAPGAEFASTHRDLAALVQTSLEEALRRRVGALARRIGVDRVALSGGVAYNCQATSALLREPGITRTFVPVAPGDTGQAVGNGLAALTQMGSRVDRDSLVSPYTGRPTTRRAWREEHTVLKNVDTASLVAELVVNGAIVGTCIGGSEFGARALGHRSILADPVSRSVRDTLNDRKGREDFMPFGCSIQARSLGRYFADTHPSPYMHHVHRVRTDSDSDLAAVIHVDGTSRVHVVEPHASPWLDDVLDRLKHRTGIPAVLNTSFNSGGCPIVESPEEAVEALDTGLVDAVAFEEAVILSKRWAGHESQLASAA